MENGKLNEAAEAATSRLPIVKLKSKRSSLFNLESDTEDLEEQWLEKGAEGMNNCQFSYPNSYIPKLKKKVKQWHKVAKNHEENRKNEQEDLNKLENTHFTEAVLSEEQREFLRSIRESFQQFLIDTDGLQEFLNFCEEN